MKIVGMAKLAARLISPSSFTRARAAYDIRVKVKGIDLRGDAAPEGAHPDHWYSDSGYALTRFLKELPIHSDEAAIDMGCGKGGGVLALARRFAKADGLELGHALVEIGRENLRRAGVADRCQIFQGDAATFTALDRYSVVYIYNAFPATVMQAAMRNLAASLSRSPRRLRIVYYNPKDGQVIEKAGFALTQKWNGGELPIHVYEAK